jgi:hypothetical protein
VDIKQFSILSVLIVPFAMIILLALIGKFVPKKIVTSFPFQTFATVWFIGIFAVPISAIYFDAQDDFFEDRYALVRDGLGMPATVEVPSPGRFSGSLGDCWSNSVNWSLEATFPSDEQLELWFAQQSYREPLVKQISAYFDTPMDHITVLNGALDPREIDKKWMSDINEPMREWWQYRRRSYFEPSVCLAIERPDETGEGLILRPCDPVVLPEDMGNMGRVILNRSGSSAVLAGEIYYATGPSYCTNPVRRAVNNALGLPHPEARRPDDGSTLPL